MPPIRSTTNTTSFKISGDQSGGTVQGTAQPGTVVEIINLSTAAVEGKKATDTFLLARADASGRFSGTLPGVQAGDILRLRNVDGSAPAGNWLTIRAQGLGADTRNAQVAVDNVSLKDLGNGKVAIGQKDGALPVSEPEAYVEVKNLRSGETALLQLDANGNIPQGQWVDGKPGDTFSIRASDGTNNDHLTQEAGRITLAGERPRVDLPDPAVHEKYKNSDGSIPELKRFTGPLFADGASPNDIKQGYLGDCYLCAAASALAHRHPELLQKAIRDNGDGSYTVDFRTQDPRTRQWKTESVTVDGDLYAKSNGQPLYGKSTGDVSPEKMELWFSVFEKAYAQWKGSYNAMGSGGQAYAVMSALTGRPGANTSIKNQPDTAWRMIKAAVDRKDPVCAGTYGKDQADRFTNTGVYANHAYTVLGYQEENGARYVQLRNPWGNSEPFEDGVNDGVFRMKLEDFMKVFQNVHTLR